MNNELRRKSQMACGMGLICLLFLLETWNADRLMAIPASPFVWALLGSVGAVCVVAALWLGLRAERIEPAP